MSPTKCKELIKNRINKIEEERLMFPGNDSYYNGKKKGLLEALEVIGMIGKQNN